MKTLVLPLLLLSSLAAAQTCSSAATCAEGELCRGGLCRQACSRDRDCGAQRWCSFQPLPDQKWAPGICLDRGAGSICAGDGDCGPGFACTGKSAMDDARLCVSTTPPKPPPPPLPDPPRKPANLQQKPVTSPPGPVALRVSRQPLNLEQPRPYRGGLVPSGYHVVEKPIGNGMLVTGVSMFSVAYLLSFASFLLNPYNPPELLPVVGPIFSMTAGRPFGGSTFTAVLVGLVNFSAQAVGLGLAIGGSAIKSRWLEPIPRKPGAVLVPGAAGSLAGASVVGRF